MRENPMAVNGTERVGKVQTVLGLIDPTELGPTMMHEHFPIADPDQPIKEGVYFTEPEDEVGKRIAREPVKIDNLWWVRYNSRQSLDNNHGLSLDDMVREVELFSAVGGGTIVDVSPRPGLGKGSIDNIVELAKRTGINIVTSAGYYIDSSHPAEARLSERSIDEVAGDMIDQILIGENGHKSGFIGELGCSWPLTPNEEKVLRASAVAQQETGTSISIHPGRNEAALGQIRDVLQSAGADLTRVVMGHIDRCGYEFDTRKDILDSGIVLEYDVFGMEGHYPADAALADGHMPDMPNDTGRIKQVKELIDLGYGEQLVVGHDMHMKFQMTRYGGWGYGHFLRTVAPLMEIWGVTADDVHRMVETTPQRLLTIQ